MAFFAWRRGALASALGLGSRIRAGKGKTCWTKPPAVLPGRWALNGAASFAAAPSEHSGRRIDGWDRGSRGFSPSLRAGSDCFDHGRASEWLSPDEPPHPDLADDSGSCSWNVDSGS
jgi:hypothetical protein